MPRNKRKICVVTGSRAEYGLLYWLMKEIENDPALTLQIVVTGMHLESKFGLTYRQIERDGFKINVKVRINLTDDTDKAITKAAGLGVKGFGEAFTKLKPDIVVVLGDRFEILAASSAALLCRIPIAHIHGGEVTEGAYDDAIRHAITKMACLHFVSHPIYAQRVIQMGEDTKRVFCFGAPGLDRINKINLLDKKILEKEIAMKLDKDIALVTFHPVTKAKGQAEGHIRSLLDALETSQLRAVFTMPNADNENKVIYNAITKYTEKNSAKSKAFKSLGHLRYLSLLKQVGIMVGNSSSGLVEAASFKLPVVNIGDRQKGRIIPENVINCSYNSGSILKAIKKGLSNGFRNRVRQVNNPFCGVDTNKRIKNKLKSVNLVDINKKSFYEI